MSSRALRYTLTAPARAATHSRVLMSGRRLEEASGRSRDGVVVGRHGSVLGADRRFGDRPLVRGEHVMAAEKSKHSFVRVDDGQRAHAANAEPSHRVEE